MNNAQLAGLDMNDEDYMKLSLRAAMHKDPEALAVMKTIEDNIHMRVECAREAWGYPKLPRAEPVADPTAALNCRLLDIPESAERSYSRDNVIPFRLPSKKQGPGFPPAA